MGDKKKHLFTPFGLVLFGLSVGYIGAEALFNMKLVDVAGSVKSDPAAIDHLQHFGRAISGYGFSLLTLGAFASSGFVMRARRYWIRFTILAALSVVPFLLEFEATLFGLIDHGVSDALNTDPLDLQLCALPFIGIAAVFLSAGKFRAHVVIGLVLMAWPTMYLGQKLVIERYLVDRTGWHERQNARYILMLRGGLEDCVLHLGELQFCDESKGATDMKAARIVVSTLWMLSPDNVLQDLKGSKDDIVSAAAAAGTWFSPQEQYGRYVGKVSAARGRQLKEFHDKYYLPYRRASEAYNNAISAPELEAEAGKASAEVEAGIDAGWKKYQDGVREYRQTLSVMAGEAMRQMLPYAQRMNDYCRGRTCPDTDIDKAMDAAGDEAEEQFLERTGYHSDLATRADFVAQRATQEKIKSSVEEIVRSRYGMRDFALPAKWTYDPGAFKERVEDMMRTQAQASWKAAFGDKVAPGLDEDKFMGALGVGNVPATEDLVMSKGDFYKTVVIPVNHRIADEMLAGLARDQSKYPPEASDMEEGKDYIEALYIPTISLVISLTVVVLTMLRGFMAFMDLVLRSGGKEVEAHWHHVGRAAVAVFFIGMLLTLPHVYPNPYASGPSYERYYGFAKDKHPVIAGVLNWAVQVQPVIYRLGKDIRRLTG